MISQQSLLQTKSPELVAEIAGHLGRIGRYDLASQVKSFEVDCVGQDRQSGELSFYGPPASPRYSLELDAPGVQITVDVSAENSLVAVHVRPPEE